MQIGPDEFEDHIDELWWEVLGVRRQPCRKGLQILEELGLECDPKTSGQKAGTMLFTEWGGHPGSSERWVDFKGRSVRAYPSSAID